MNAELDSTDDGMYEPAFVRGLFDEMAHTYGLMNLITSFGFAALWRRQCLTQIAIPPGSRAVDLMTGMGELCTPLSRRLGAGGSIRGLDLSPVMCDRARGKVKTRPGSIVILEGDALNAPLETASADVVVSSFGLKTFSDGQLEQLASEVARILVPGGVFSFLEISLPPWRLLRWPYAFYIGRVIPLLGWMLLGNPENYRMLGVYTAAFRNCDRAAVHFANAGLSVTRTSHFFGCATGLNGCKPVSVGSRFCET